MLEEKGVRYRLEEIDIFAEDEPSLDYLRRHPFGKIPALDHDGFRLYETAAIARYVDEAFEGPPLTPSAAQDRARMTQVVSLLDSYGYRALVWDLFVERLRKPQEGAATDEAKVAKGLETTKRVFGALQDLMCDQPFLAGAQLSLADLHAAPIFAYGRLVQEVAELLTAHEPVDVWWRRMAERPSMARTRSPLEP